MDSRMARARNIKPGFFINEELAQCEPLARLLFAGLWCWADRDGRLEERVMRLKAQILPYDDCDIDSLLAQLAQRSFIIRYASESCKCIQIVNFHLHQHPHVKEMPSTIPAPDLSGSKTSSYLIPHTSHFNPHTESRDISCHDVAPVPNDDGSEDSPTVNEPTESVYPELFETFWNIYPLRGGRKRGKKKAFSFWKSVRAADRQSVVQAATNYAASREAKEGYARDPERFLKSEWWREWLENEVPEASRSRVPTEEDMKNWNPVDGGLTP